MTEESEGLRFYHLYTNLFSRYILGYSKKIDSNILDPQCSRALVYNNRPFQMLHYFSDIARLYIKRIRLHRVCTSLWDTIFDLAWCWTNRIELGTFRFF